MQRYLQELETTAGCDIAWAFVEDYGGPDERYHFHLLIGGVDHLSTRSWELKAGRRFGNSEIKPYNRHDARYIAKKVVEENRDLHLGGALLSR
jgi:hypothetical protein